MFRTGAMAEKTRSRIWPLLCVGKVMCWVRLKLSSRAEKSEACLQVGESMWMLKSPTRSRGSGEDEARIRSSDRSEMKDEFGLGGW